MKKSYEFPDCDKTDECGPKEDIGMLEECGAHTEISILLSFVLLCCTYYNAYASGCFLEPAYLEIWFPLLLFLSPAIRAVLSFVGVNQAKAYSVAFFPYIILNAIMLVLSGWRMVATVN